MDSQEALGRFPLFRNIAPTTWQEISTALREVTLAAGEYLCRQGEPGDSLFLIDSGLIEVWLETPAGTHLVRRLRQGDIVGEMELLTGEPRAAHVIANVPSIVLELDAQTFASITVRNPKVLHNIALTLIEREHASAKVRLQPARGEAVALVIDDGHLSIASAVVAAFEPGDRGQVDERATFRPDTGVVPGWRGSVSAHTSQREDRSHCKTAAIGDRDPVAGPSPIPDQARSRTRRWGGEGLRARRGVQGPGRRRVRFRLRRRVQHRIDPRQRHCYGHAGRRVVGDGAQAVVPRTMRPLFFA